jgi:hypothetical protein
MTDIAATRLNVVRKALQRDDRAAMQNLIAEALNPSMLAGAIIRGDLSRTLRD